MTDFRGTWAAEGVEAFLQDVTIPIRIATRRPDDSLWLVALWYRYRDGVFECATGANADVGRFLRINSDVGFDVSTNEPPYRGIRGYGNVSLAPDRDKTVLRDLIGRYLGKTDSSLAESLLSGDREEIRIRIEPYEIYSWDYTDRMKTAVGR